VTQASPRSTFWQAGRGAGHGLIEIPALRPLSRGPEPRHSRGPRQPLRAGSALQFSGRDRDSGFWARGSSRSRFGIGHPRHHGSSWAVVSFPRSTPSADGQDQRHAGSRSTPRRPPRGGCETASSSARDGDTRASRDESRSDPAAFGDQAGTRRQRLDTLMVGSRHAERCRRPRSCRFLPTCGSASGRGAWARSTRPTTSVADKAHRDGWKAKLQHRDQPTIGKVAFQRSLPGGGLNASDNRAPVLPPGPTGRSNNRASDPRPGCTLTGTATLSLGLRTGPGPRERDGRGSSTSGSVLPAVDSSCRTSHPTSTASPPPAAFIPTLAGARGGQEAWPTPHRPKSGGNRCWRNLNGRPRPSPKGRHLLDHQRVPHHSTADDTSCAELRHPFPCRTATHRSPGPSRS